MNEIKFVFYKDSNGYHPALVTKVFKNQDEDKEPDVALCVFVAGYHSPTFGVPRVKHGDKANEYLHADELPEEKVEVKEPAEAPVVNVDLTKPITKPAEQKKAAKEPKAKQPKEPNAKPGKQQQDEATGEGNSEPSA